MLILDIHWTYGDAVLPLQFPIVNPRTGAGTGGLLITKGTSVYVGMSAANTSRMPRC